MRGRRLREQNLAFGGVSDRLYDTDLNPLSSTTFPTGFPALPDPTWQPPRGSRTGSCRHIDSVQRASALDPNERLEGKGTPFPAGDYTLTVSTAEGLADTSSGAALRTVDATARYLVRLVP
jgi:hypothetical protein